MTVYPSELKIELARHSVMKELYHFHEQNVLRRFGIHAPRNSFERWILEHRLRVNNRNTRSFDPLIPTRMIDISSVLYREILEDLPIKPYFNQKKPNHGLNEYINRICQISGGREALGDLATLEVQTFVEFKDAVREIQHAIRHLLESNYGRQIRCHIRMLQWKAKTLGNRLNSFDNTDFNLVLEPAIMTLNGQTKLLFSSTIERLRSRYRGEDFKLDVSRLLVRYHTMFGPKSHTLHLSIPTATFDILRSRLGVRFESFASPFNVTLDCYYSLFPDIDMLFGSHGNFFEVRRIYPRSYQANPPFTEEYIQAMSGCIIECLTRNKKAMSFSIFVPVWDDAIGVQQLLNSSFLRGIRKMESNEHYYLIDDMARDRRSNPKKSVCGTYFLVLQNMAGSLKWSVDDSILDEIVSSMMNI